jgi:Lecithin:cholesterol acyltransferase
MSDLESAGAGAPANGDPAGNTTCNCPPKQRTKVPIVFCPGIMGSRVHLPGCNQSWDPDDGGLTGAMFHWWWSNADTKRNELRWTNRGQIMGKHPEISDDEANHGYGGVVYTFYVDLLRHMRGLGQTGLYNQNYENPVYAVGYDWRQSNKDSGAALKTAVEGILKKEGAAKCILVSHSMGGIVQRSAMKQGLQGSVLGAIHITQPVDGAVVMYRRCFTGAIEEMDPDGMGGKLDTILGNDPSKYVTVACGLPGALQLLPTDNYKDEGKPWLNYKDGGKSGTWSGDVWALYMSPQSPPGISPPGLSDKGVMADLKTNLNTAKSFHADLQRFQHPQTRLVASTGLTTDCSVLFDPPKQPTSSILGFTYNQNWKYQGVQRQAPAKGDGTVPHASADVLKTSTDVTGIGHGDACKSQWKSPVWDDVDKWIKEFLS